MNVAATSPDSDRAATQRGEELVARAASLAPMLAEQARAAESARRVPSETFAAIRAADLLRAYVPQRFGGYELPPRWFWRVAAELARGCPSTSWVYSVLSCHTFLLGMFPEAGQSEIFAADPNVAVCGVLPDRSTAVAVDGGYRIKNGLWPFGSGCHNANWAMLGFELDGDPPGYNKLFCMVPMAEIDIVDDWRVAGLKATGSNSLRLNADELFVPAHRALKAETALAHKYGEHRPMLYRMPMGPTLALSLGLGATVGAARGALAYFEDLVRNRSNRRMVYTDDVRKAELPATRRVLADAIVRLDAACLMADRACDLAAEAAANWQHVPDNELRARIRLYGVHVMHECRDIVASLTFESGGSSLHENNPMQRYNRDVQAMTMHEAMHLDTISDTFGRMRLGQPTTHWLL